MSLKIGKWFYRAINDDATVHAFTSGRIYPVARNMEQDAEDAIPYVIIAPETFSEVELSKDYVGDTYHDEVTVSVLACCVSYDDLVDLATAIRDAVDTYFQTVEYDGTWDFTVDDYTFAADAPQLDPTKPCFYQTLRFRCETSPR